MADSPLARDYTEALIETLEQVEDTIQATLEDAKPIDRVHDLLPEAVDFLRVLDTPTSQRYEDDLHIILGLLHAVDHTILDERASILTQASRWLRTTLQNIAEDQDTPDTPWDHPLSWRRNHPEGTLQDIAKLRQEEAALREAFPKLKS